VALGAAAQHLCRRDEPVTFERTSQRDDRRSLPRATLDDLRQPPDANRFSVLERAERDAHGGCTVAACASIRGPAG
jgi:hypothetical protein